MSSSSFLAIRITCVIRVNIDLELVMSQAEHVQTLYEFQYLLTSVKKVL